MPFFLFFFLLVTGVVVNANDIKIRDTFNNLNIICIYNASNTKIKSYLEDKTNSQATVTQSFTDYTGVLVKKSGTGKVTIEPDNLRKKVIYYKLFLTGPREDNYYLHISADSDGMYASRCPTDALAKIANTTPGGIANAAIFAGVLVGVIFFAGVVWALLPIHPEKDFDE